MSYTQNPNNPRTLDLLEVMVRSTLKMVSMALAAGSTPAEAIAQAKAESTAGPAVWAEVDARIASA